MIQNLERIYPKQRKKVKMLLEEILRTSRENVNRVIVFGSSATGMCHPGSDVDIYVDLKSKPIKCINKYMPFEFDLWTNFMVDERLLREIERGVVVYEAK